MTLSYYFRNRERILAKQKLRRQDPEFQQRAKEYSRLYYQKHKHSKRDGEIKSVFSISRGCVYNVYFD